MADPNIIDQLRSETDRGVAIVGGSIVEAHLKNAILSRFHPLSNTRRDDLFNGFGPLATFSAKIEIGSALGLFGQKAREDLDIEDCAQQICASSGGWAVGLHTP
jgi:hypothetical protein